VDEAHAPIFRYLALSSRGRLLNCACDFSGG
jgi:hypothetical protein